ncbi:5-phosphohydroxy-L-lysine phospho-lyase-like isoform X3 [Oratosquilla oratoria]|uniref:5-phosphohydroxy-L-lysine phospho-lyase-like isoform X3 n=1 Tax=Oratosquilla oratoria TaxID=337810 RepID=UPI003F771603
MADNGLPPGFTFRYPLNDFSRGLSEGVPLNGFDSDQLSQSGFSQSQEDYASLDGSSRGSSSGHNSDLDAGASSSNILNGLAFCAQLNSLARNQHHGRNRRRHHHHTCHSHHSHHSHPSQHYHHGHLNSREQFHLGGNFNHLILSNALRGHHHQHQRRQLSDGESNGSSSSGEESDSILSPDRSLHVTLGGLAKSCHLQYEHSPLKIVRASYQYMYDEADVQYLDCIGAVAHVGHCHPAVVEASTAQMSTLVSTTKYFHDAKQYRYPEILKQTMPDHLNTLLFCNSGSEAIDLALQLARLYTGADDAIVVDNSFHGSLDSVQSLSPKILKSTNMSAVDWVHTLTMPDLYRGPYRDDDPEAIDKYLTDARQMLEYIESQGRKIACFLCEPFLTVAGCIEPPPRYLQGIYKMVKERGALCIADEVQTGLGRIGSHFWSFEVQAVSPDILIIGKPIGNGHPMAIVATSQQVASCLDERIHDYQCSPLVDAVGCAVLQVLDKEQLVPAAAKVGVVLKKGLYHLKQKHEYIGTTYFAGDIRGQGLVLGIEIVWSKQSRKPAKGIAQQIVYKMKEKNIIVANEGESRNILLIMPPMCFTQDNANTFICTLDKVLTELSSGSSDHFNSPAYFEQSSSGEYPGEGRIGIIQPTGEKDDDEDSTSSNRDAMDTEYFGNSSYHDLD